MNKIAYCSLLLLFVAFSCGEADKDPIIPTPTNLNFTVEKAVDNSGLVSVTATADNAAYFTFDFGEGIGMPVSSTDGNAQYTYSSSGTYTLKVQAVGTKPTLFIEKTESISISVTFQIPTTDGYTTPTNHNGYTLVWQDEFNGTAVNEADWTFETGGHGWGNNELEYYRKENAVVQDGFLVITAKKESFSGSSYTSTRMITKGKQEFQYGRIDIRALLPKGQGIWPALWMLGSNFPGVQWPKCGEIDVMEMIGGAGREKTVHGTTHWWDTDALEWEYYGGHMDLTEGTFNDKFHVFTIIWDADLITWYVDDVKFHEFDTTPTNAPERFDEFRQEFFLIFNIAVGGNWPGNPDVTTTFPQRMIVDYVRVFQ